MSEEITLRLSSPSQPPGFFLADDASGSVWILSLVWRGAAHRAGVVPNSILCAVDGGSVRSAADAAARIRERAGGASSSGAVAVVLSVRAPAPECGYRGSLLTRAVTQVTREGKERLTLAVFDDLVALHRGRHDAARVLAVSDVAAVTSVVARGSLVVVVRVAGGEAGDELLFSQDADAPGNPPGDGEDIVGVVAGLMAMRQAGDGGGGGGGGGSGSEAAGGSRTRSRSRRGSTRSRRSDRTVEAPQPQPQPAAVPATAALDVYDRHTQGVAEEHPPGELRLVNALRLPEDCDAVKSLVAKHVVYACVSCEVVGGGGGGGAAARLLLVTDRAVYELRPDGALVRCFAAAAVAEVLCCAATGHVAMRVPGQPDLLVRVTGASATATRVTEAVSLVSPCVPVRMLDYTPPAELAQKLFLDPPRSWRFTPDMMIAFTPRSIDPHEAAIHGTLGSHGLPPPPPPPPHASRAHSPVRMRSGGDTAAAAASDPPPPPPAPLPSRPTAAELELRGAVMELRSQLDAVSGEMQRMRRLSELERRSERDRTATSAAGAALADRRLAELEVASAVLGDAIVQQAASASPPPPLLPPAQAPLSLSPYRLEPPLPLSGLSAGVSPLEPVVGYAAVAMREAAAAAAASPALPGESRVLFQRVPPARTAAVGRYP